MFLSSPARPTRRIATSPLVISSSPELPSLRDIGSQPPKPPAFKSPTPVTPNRRARPGVTSAPDGERERVNLSPTPDALVHESHYRVASKASTGQEGIHSHMPQKNASKGVIRPPIVLSSPLKGSSPVTESAYFKQPASVAAEPDTTTTATTERSRDEPLNIERAPMRRLDWTPPRQQSPVIVPGNSSPTTEARDAVEEAGLSFSKVLELYKCDTDAHNAAPAKPDEEGNVFRKRKLIDAVSTRPESGASGSKAPAAAKKKPSAKKKPRTITGLATAAYKIASQPDLPTVDENQATDSKQATECESGQKGSATRAKKRAARAPRKSKKKVTPPKPILLSPSTAMRQVANQDFLFGTSSQLAQDHSPRFLRDLATATKQSNEIDYIPVETPINSDAVEPLEAKSLLWNAAARNEDGDLFDLGVQELAEKSQDLPPAAQADAFGYVREASPAQDDSFLSLSDALKPASPINTESLPVPRTKEPASSFQESSSVPCSQDTGLAAPVSIAREVAPRAPRPDFELYTDAQLASAVSSYGFKNVRQRGARIALLDKCWQGTSQINTAPGTRAASSLSSSKTRSPTRTTRLVSPLKTPARPESSLAIASQPEEPPPSAQPVSPPKRPRGRPRKATASISSLTESVSICAAAALPSLAAQSAPSTPKRRKADKPKFAIEIPDSESDACDLDDLSASPSSVPDETFTPSQTVDLSLSMDDDTELSISISPDDKPVSFEYISKAITSAPRTKDVNNPSWHEKILLYDPIVLEDLAAWLNCGPLTKAGYDDEVSSGEVKKWCESKSICCLWKVNLRGKERKRY